MGNRSYGANLYGFTEKEISHSLDVTENRAGLTTAPLMEKAALLALDWPEKWIVALAIAVQVASERRRLAARPNRITQLEERANGLSAHR